MAYIEYYKQINSDEGKMEFDEIKNMKIDGIPAKQIKERFPLKKWDYTRVVYEEVVIFIVGGYIYTIALNSFDKDFPQASKEFESMIKTFKFNIPDKYKKGHELHVKKMIEGNYSF